MAELEVTTQTAEGVEMLHGNELSGAVFGLEKQGWKTLGVRSPPLQLTPGRWLLVLPGVRPGLFRAGFHSAEHPFST